MTSLDPGVTQDHRIAANAADMLAATANDAEALHDVRHLHQVIDALPAAIYTTDAQGRLTHFNAAAVELSGRVPDLASDRWCPGWKLYRRDGSSLPHDQCPMAVAVREGRAVRGEEIIVERPDGARQWVQPYPTPIRDADGKLTGAINLLIDISDLKRAEAALLRRVGEQAALYRFTDRLQRAKSLDDIHQAAIAAIVDALGADHVSILLFDAAGSMRFVAWRGLSDGYRAAVEGHSPWKPGEKNAQPICIGDVEASDLPDALRATVLGEGIRALAFVPLVGSTLLGKFMVYYDAPHAFSTEELGLAVTLGQHIGFAVERKRAEDERRVAEAALLEANRRKDEFLATLAHELRNPLAPILNSLEVVKRASGDRGLFVQARDTIERQTLHLVRLVDDLLDVSRISRSRLDLRVERVDLGEVLASALETSRPLIAAAAHDLHLDLPGRPVWVDADPVRLAQVFANLLNNAAKYSERAGRIWLSARQDSGSVEVRVRDAGIGISAAMLPHIFEMFVQGELSREFSRGGLGIGLTLVRQLVQLHGGSVEARSEGLGRGSEFRVRLPCAAPVANAGAGAGAGAATALATAVAPARRVLVVDDNRDAASSLADLLRLLGHAVQVAYDGADALAQVAQFAPQVVLLDLGMPRLDGFETARRMRAGGGPGLVLVALTGWGQEEDRRRTREAGFDHHLVKPADLKSLENLLAG